MFFNGRLVYIMKSIFIFPPQLNPEEVYLAPPLLASQLLSNGVDVECMDLNVQFYDEIFNKKYLENVYKNLEKINENIDEEIEIARKGLSKSNLTFDDLTHKKELVKKQLENEARRTNILKYIETASKVIKTPELFYDEKTLYKAQKILRQALDVIQLQYYPLYLSFDIEENKAYKLNYKDIKSRCFDAKNNIYINFYKNKIDEIIKKNPDFIAISVPFSHQVYSAFTLGRLIKEVSDIPVVMGGNILTRVVNNVLKYPEIFNLYTDYMLIGDGEESIIKFAKNISDKTQFQNIPGLIYKDENSNIKYNEPVPVSDVNNIFDTKYELIDFSKYFSPEPIIPIQFSKGCYWGKCQFCDFFYGKPFYSTKTPKQAADIIEKIVKEQNIRVFDIKDESISPAFYDKFADEIIKRKLDIHYYSYCRFEKKFDKKLLKKMKKSGLYGVFWGFEAASERVMNLINKGVDLNERARILKDSYSAGIANRVGFILGFPTETYEEALETIKFYKKYKKYIASSTIEPFRVTKHAPILKRLEFFGITEVIDAEEFSDSYEYKYSGLSDAQKDELLELFYKEYHSQVKNTFVNYFNNFSSSYIMKYGLKFLRKKYDKDFFKRAD